MPKPALETEQQASHFRSSRFSPGIEMKFKNRLFPVIVCPAWIPELNSVERGPDGKGRSTCAHEGPGNLAMGPLGGWQVPGQPLWLSLPPACRVRRKGHPHCLPLWSIYSRVPVGESCEIFNRRRQSWLHSRIAFGGRGQVRGVLGYFLKKKNARTSSSEI